ncbi:MAG: TlpA family protein disulfide reductase [Acidobacteriia bacterium]|nr:TlpA family protein disulfide reductase [Terriglobia bacterium]
MAHGKHLKLLQAGAPAPDFRLQHLGGGEVTLRELVAKGPALLAFFKVNCPVCQMTFPFLERLQTPGRLPVYGISQNCVEDTVSFNRHFGITFPMLLDPEGSGFPASNAYGISSVPTLFLVEQDGTIAEVTEGWRKSEIERLGARSGVNPFRPTDSVPEAKAG